MVRRFRFAKAVTAQAADAADPSLRESPTMCAKSAVPMTFGGVQLATERERPLAAHVMAQAKSHSNIH